MRAAKEFVCYFVAADGEQGGTDEPQAASGDAAVAQLGRLGMVGGGQDRGEIHLREILSNGMRYDGLSASWDLGRFGPAKFLLLLQEALMLDSTVDDSPTFLDLILLSLP